MWVLCEFSEQYLWGRIVYLPDSKRDNQEGGCIWIPSPWNCHFREQILYNLLDMTSRHWPTFLWYALSVTLSILTQRLEYFHTCRRCLWLKGNKSPSYREVGVTGLGVSSSSWVYSHLLPCFLWPSCYRLMDGSSFASWYVNNHRIAWIVTYLFTPQSNYTSIYNRMENFGNHRPFAVSSAYPRVMRHCSSFTSVHMYFDAESNMYAEAFVSRSNIF